MLGAVLERDSLRHFTLPESSQESFIIQRSSGRRCYCYCCCCCRHCHWLFLLFIVYTLRDCSRAAFVRFTCLSVCPSASLLACFASLALCGLLLLLLRCSLLCLLREQLTGLLWAGGRALARTSTQRLRLGGTSTRTHKAFVRLALLLAPQLLAPHLPALLTPHIGEICPRIDRHS